MHASEKEQERVVVRRHSKPENVYEPKRLKEDTKRNSLLLEDGTHVTKRTKEDSKRHLVDESKRKLVEEPPVRKLSNVTEENENEEEEGTLLVKYELYTRRWFILAVFCALTLTNGMMWITFSPISTYVEEHYHVGATAVNMLSLVYMILYIPFVFLSSWIIDHKGLKAGVIVGAFANCVGAWVRCIPGGFAWALVGQCICAFAQTFLLSAPVKLAANWFGGNERTTATSIGALSNQIGVAVGFFMPAAIATTPSKIHLLLIIQAAMASGVLALVLVGFRTSIPPTPPSRTAATEKTKFLLGLRDAAHEKYFWVLLIGFGIGVGVFYALCTLLNQLLEEYHYSQKESGILGSVILFVGLGGALVAGPLLDCTKSFRLLCTLSFAGLLGGMSWFAFSLQANNLLILLFCCGFIGFFATAMLPLCLEAGVEATYPVAEGLSSGLLLMFAQVFGIIITLVLQTVQEKYNTKVAVYAQMGIAGLALLIILFFNTKYKRMEAERATD